MHSTIAIVEPQYLYALGLQQILRSLLPSVEVVRYDNVEECQHDINRTDGARPYFVHFFVADSLLANSATADFFRSLPQITIALSHSAMPIPKTFPVLNLAADEATVYQQLLHLHHGGHSGTQAARLRQANENIKGNRETQHGHISTNIPLSAREIDVLRLVAKGLLNKEIADRLCISQNTVITHRMHITEKLGIRSVSALTVYAVLNDIVSYEEIYSSSNEPREPYDPH